MTQEISRLEQRKQHVLKFLCFVFLVHFWFITFYPRYITKIGGSYLPLVGCGTVLGQGFLVKISLLVSCSCFQTLLRNDGLSQCRCTFLQNLFHSTVSYLNPGFLALESLLEMSQRLTWLWCIHVRRPAKKKKPLTLHCMQKTPEVVDTTYLICGCSNKSTKNMWN